MWLWNLGIKNKNDKKTPGNPTSQGKKLARHNRKGPRQTETDLTNKPVILTFFTGCLFSNSYKVGLQPGSWDYTSAVVLIKHFGDLLNVIILHLSSFVHESGLDHMFFEILYIVWHVLLYMVILSNCPFHIVLQYSLSRYRIFLVCLIWPDCFLYIERESRKFWRCCHLLLPFYVGVKVVILLNYFHNFYTLVF